MKRITEYNIINIFLIITYITLILVQSATNVFLISNNLFWFVTFLLLWGVSLIFKFLIFKSDSSLWFGVTLLCIAITFCLIVYLKLNIKQFYVLFLISPIIGSLIVGLIFKDVLQFKLIIYILCIFIPIFLFKLNIVNGIFCAIILVASFIFAIFILNLLPNIFLNKKSKE